VAGEGFGHVIVQGVKASLVLLAVESGIGGVTAATVASWPGILSGLAGVGGASGFGDSVVNGVMIGLGAIFTRLGEAIESFGWTDVANVLWLIGAGLVIVVLAVVALIAALILGAVVTAMVLFLQFAIAVVAFFGPIFVALLLFDSTRGMFFTWLASALSYALATAIIGLAVRVLNTAILTLTTSQLDSLEGAAASMGAGDATAAMFAAIPALLTVTAACIIGLIFIMQASSIAQGMAGGGGGSSGAIASALIPSTYTIRSLTRGLANAFKPRASGGAGGLANAGARAGAGGLGSNASQTAVMRARGPAPKTATPVASGPASPRPTTS